MFRGRYEHNLDEKGRVQLPAAYKRELKRIETEILVLTTHISSPCLVAYPLVEWERFEERLAQLPQFEPSVTALRRLYVGSAIECAIDKQGRLLIPPTLREYAALERDAFWVGAMRTFELWSKTNWQAVVEAERKAVSPEVLRRLGEMGL